MRSNEFDGCIAWVVAADMGYGHQRAVYPLRGIAEEGIIVVGKNDAASKTERQLWTRLLGCLRGPIARARHSGDRQTDFPNARLAAAHPFILPQPQPLPSDISSGTPFFPHPPGLVCGHAGACGRYPPPDRNFVLCAGNRR